MGRASGGIDHPPIIRGRRREIRCETDDGVGFFAWRRPAIRAKTGCSMTAHPPAPGQQIGRECLFFSVRPQESLPTSPSGVDNREGRGPRPSPARLDARLPPRTEQQPDEVRRTSRRRRAFVRRRVAVPGGRRRRPAHRRVLRDAASARCWPRTACRATAPTSSRAACGSTPRPACSRAATPARSSSPATRTRARSIQAVRHDGDVQDAARQGRSCPTEAIDALTAWVKMGAPWPDGPRRRRQDAVDRRGAPASTGRSSRCRSRPLPAVQGPGLGEDARSTPSSWPSWRRRAWRRRRRPTGAR